MKKLLVFCIALICWFPVHANPLLSPEITVSELMFDSTGNWVIELAYQHVTPGLPITNIWIRSVAGEAQLKPIVLTDQSGILVVTNDSLTTPLAINPLADSLIVAFSFNEYYVLNGPALVYGYPHASVRRPLPGQSIASVGWSFYEAAYSIDKSPGIGLPNDSTGTCGTLHGKVFDRHGQLLSTTIRQFSTTPSVCNLSILPDNAFSGRVHSFKHKITHLYHWSGTRSYWTSIEPIEFWMTPDSVVNIDIHLSQDLITLVEELPSNTSTLFQLTPNPVKGAEVRYHTTVPVRSANAYVELIDASGKQLLQFALADNEGIVTLPASITNGLYFVNLVVNKKKLATQRLMVVRP